MKLNAANQKTFDALPKEVQEAIESNVFVMRNKYQRFTDVGPLRPFLNYFNEKEIPQKEKSVEGEVIIEADLSKCDFEERLFIHTKLKDVVEEAPVVEEVANDNTRDGKVEDKKEEPAKEDDKK